MRLGLLQTISTPTPIFTAIETYWSWVREVVFQDWSLHLTVPGRYVVVSNSLHHSTCQKSYIELTIVCTQTVLTDYPDQSLIDNLSYNVDRNVPESIRSNVTVTGYVWGKPVEPLLEAVAPDKFGLIILSDLVFNHSQVRLSSHSPL